MADMRDAAMKESAEGLITEYVRETQAVVANMVGHDDRDRAKELLVGLLHWCDAWGVDVGQLLFEAKRERVALLRDAGREA